MSKITVITVTYNSQRTIESCLSSIIKYSFESEIIVVDNGSTDSTLELVRTFGRKVKIINAGKNLGFSKANNLGAKEAEGNYLVFLNPDTRILKAQDLERLQKILEENPEYGVLGPKLIYPDNTPQPRVRNLPTPFRAFKEYILGMKGAYDFYEPEGQGLCEVESVIGACMIISKELFFRVGGFDEKYFMYYEDLELCRSVRRMGFKVGYIPEITVEHAEGKSGVNQKTAELLRTSAKKYFGSAYYFIELILTPRRILNKVRTLTHRPANA